MENCKHYGQRERPGARYCGQCGIPLYGDLAAGNKAENEKVRVASPEVTHPAAYIAILLGGAALIFYHINSNSEGFEGSENVEVRVNQPSLEKKVGEENSDSGIDSGF